MDPEGEKTTATFALIALGTRKDDLRRLVRTHRRHFARWRLLATGSTGRMLADDLGLSVEVAEGGLQMAAVVEGRVDAVIFLDDLLTAHPHDADVQTLIRLCDVHRVPLATNLASAEILIHFFADHDRQVRRAGARTGGDG